MFWFQVLGYYLLVYFFLAGIMKNTALDSEFIPILLFVSYIKRCSIQLKLKEEPIKQVTPKKSN